jgi:hypothetical protein
MIITLYYLELLHLFDGPYSVGIDAILGRECPSLAHR